QLRLQAIGLEQQAQRAPDRVIVIDDEYRGCFVLHESSGATGSVKEKRAPRGVLAWQVSWLWCESRIERLMGRPSPVPSALVVKKGSNTRASAPGARPGPLSATLITTWPSSLRA